MNSHPHFYFKPPSSGTSKMGFQHTSSNLLKFVTFWTKPCLIHTLHIIVNQPFNIIFFHLMPLENCDFYKILQIFRFLAILASHLTLINLQNTLVLLIQIQTYTDFRKNQTLKVICSVLALLQNLKFLQFCYPSWQVLILKLL